MIDERYYGKFGGSYVPESLVQPLFEIEHEFKKLKDDPNFNLELNDLLKNYLGRETPITFASKLSDKLGRRIYLKREDLVHGGAHKSNNTVGQCLLAKHMGKPRVIAETGAGQHGVATAMVAAKFGLQAKIYMGRVDVERQAQNVQRMRLFGAEVEAVDSGSATLKDAINEALRDWIKHVDDTYYIFGTVAGPYPFPQIVRHFQTVIGREARQQMLDQTGGLPDAVYACVGGGSNAIGIFSGFLDDASVKILGAEAGGEGLNKKHAATLNKGEAGVFHGAASYYLQDDDGQIVEAHSISAGLDYPGVGPEHAFLHETKRVEYHAITDEEALDAFKLLTQEEGIIPAFESAHALALALKHAKEMPEGSKLLVNISGRGDKDLDTYIDMRGCHE